MGYKLMIFWNLGLVDTFSVVKICVNCGSQYMGVVFSSAAGNSSDLGIPSLLEPTALELVRNKQDFDKCKSDPFKHECKL